MLRPATRARKTIPKPVPKKRKTLRPPHTGGKLFLPGFHRTRQESAAASIIIDSLRADKLRGTCLYGKGFYMTRTFSNQNTGRMIGSYGTHLVRVKVDVSRFVCFDRAVAKRVWGEKHTLADQLKTFGPWTTNKQDLIDQYSKQLLAFWTDRRSKDAVYKREYSNRYEKIRHSADIARLAFKYIQIHEKVPGIMYTGGSDGACVLAYHLDRVTPIAMATAPKEKALSKTLDWVSSNDRRIRRKHTPDVALRDDIQTYLQKLAPANLTTAQRIALITDSYAALPTDPFDQFAFAIAVGRLARSKALHDIRDTIYSEAAPRILHLLHLTMPHFCYSRNDGRASGDVSMRLYAKLGSIQDHESPAEAQAMRMRYLKPILKNALLWDYLRYQFFNQIAAYHREVFWPEARQKLHAVINHKDAWMTDERMTRQLSSVLFPLFGGYINRYGLIISEQEIKASQRFRNTYSAVNKTEGLLLLKEMLSGIRDEDASRRSKPDKIPVFYGLIGADEYLHFMRSQMLKLYDALRADPVIKGSPIAMKILNRWHRMYGRHHKAAVRVEPCYDAIGGAF